MNIRVNCTGAVSGDSRPFGIFLAWKQYLGIFSDRLFKNYGDKKINRFDNRDIKYDRNC